ncbi:MAG: RNA polymerase sigma-70 factor [Deltaproteobacteria bacterium]|nr:RNA polymerase sigma-70 factor [Deltaproteobacteria bacterium]
MKEKRRIRSLTGGISQGDEKAFREIYYLYYERLWRFACEYIIDPGEAENVVQNCFLKLWERRDRVDEDFHISAWFFTVVKHDCLSFISHKKLVAEKADDLVFRELKVNYDALANLEFSKSTLFEIKDLVESTLEELNPNCRKVFELSRYKNKRHKEIAEELGLSEKSVEAYITTALKKLRIALRDYLRQK